MVQLLKFDIPRTFHNTVLAIGMGSEGITSLEYMKEKGIQGVDFDDVRSVTKSGGYGFLSVGQASGENRVEKAVRMAMPAASLNTNQTGLTGNLPLYIYFGPHDITMQEIGEIQNIFQKVISPQGDIIWNCGYDPTLKEDLRITVIRTGLDKPPVLIKSGHLTLRQAAGS